MKTPSELANEYAAAVADYQSSMTVKDRAYLAYLCGWNAAMDEVLDLCSAGGRVLNEFADGLCADYGIVPLRERE